MPVIEPLSQHVIPFQLVLFRIAGLFVFAPMLASTGVPVQARTLLAVALAVAVYPMVPTHAQSAPDLDLLQLVPMIASETLLGVSMGLIALLPLIGMQMGGQVAGHQMGLGLAQSFNPALDVDSDVTGQLLFFLGVTIFIAVGGIEALFVGVLGTFEHLPAGGLAPDRAPLELFVGVLSAGMELALRVAAPAIGALLLVMLGMGFIMKTMPQINILSVGFPFKVLVGLAVMLLSMWIIHEVAREEIRRVVELVVRWADGLAPRAAPVQSESASLSPRNGGGSGG